MDNMPNGVNLQKQIASIMDVLAKAAVAEISKVVDDGVVMLRLEICERENEIDTLKRNLQVVSDELRATRRALVRECVSGRSRQFGPSQGGQGVKEKDKRGTERESENEDLNGQREDVNMVASGVKVKLETVEDGEQMVQDANQNTRPGLVSHSDSTDNEQLWSPEENPDMHSPEYFHSTHDQSQHRSDPAVSMERSYGPLEDRLETGCPNVEDVARHSEHATDSLHVAPDELLRAQNSSVLQQSHSNTHNTIIHPHADGQTNFSALGVPARGRLMNGGGDMDKRRFPCMFCGKCFDRLSHVERHQRIHTGEKPFSCRLCGRCFTQKCSLKSHLKTHRGFSGVTDAASGLSGDDNHFSSEWSVAPHCEEQIAHHSFINGQDMHTEEQNSQLCQESTHFINAEEERLDQPHVDRQRTLINPDSSPPRRPKCTDLHDEKVIVDPENSLKTEKREEDKSQMLTQTLSEPRCLNTGSECVVNEEVLCINTASTGEDLAESSCCSRTEYSSHQSKYPLETTSTILHSWETAAGNNAKSFESKHIHVKEEEEDISPLDEEETSQEMSYALQAEEHNVASPIEQGSSAGSFRTIEALMVPDLPSNPLPQRSIVLNGVPRRRERRFPCVLCGKRFDRLSHLERHQRIHTGEKPYSCGMCGRRFTQKSSLNGHMRTHTRERAFHCSSCGMSFATRASRYRHSCNQTETGYLR